MHLCQGLFQSSKHLLNSISGIAFKAFFDSACISSIVSKRCPRSDLLSLGNSQKRTSHTEPNQANMVVVERYASSFWRNGHEERVQCETPHYRDAKTTSCLPKISFETVLSDPLEMPIVSARTLIVNRWFLCSNSLIWLTCCSSVDVDGRPGVPSHQHVLCLPWSLCTTYKHFSVTWSNHRRPSATFWTFSQLKFHSANKI